MELYIGNTSYATNHSRTMQQTIDEIKELGFNMVRLPLAPQTLDPNDPMGQPALWKNYGGAISELAPYNGGSAPKNATEFYEAFVRLLDDNDLKILVDIHSCSNYLGWRAGRLDSNPPYADAERVNYNYKREDYSCGGGAQNDQPYNEAIWLEDLRYLANLNTTLGVENIIGIDIFNEPWDYTMAEWGTLAWKAYQAIAEENDDMLVFVEGVAGKTSAEIEVPHGSEDSNPNWGENFYGILDTDFAKIPKERVVLSPHTYGPSVFVQNHHLDLSDPACAGLEADAAGEAGCKIKIDPTVLEPAWEEHFGYLRDEGYAMVVGEWGGNLGWPSEADSATDREVWGNEPDGIDLEWQKAFANYMAKKGIHSCYWSINPESADTGGIYRHAYHPTNNTAAWGEWLGLDTRKTGMLQMYWNGATNQ